MVSSLMSFMCLLVMTCVTATRVAGGDLALTTHDENEEMTQMTCKTGSSNFCNGDWKYLGNENCCTSKWAQCTKGSSNFCNGAWKYLGNDQCCITSDHQVWITEVKGSSNFCSGDWKYLGNDKCVTSKWAKCTKGSSNFCNAAWKYLGNDQCCITSDHQVWLTEVKGSFNFCYGD